MPPFPIFDCQSCGACCAFSATWPALDPEDWADGASIPAHLLHPAGDRMLCVGDRCAALDGTVGERVACTVYAVRPAECRACQPGSGSCLLARGHWGLAG